MMPPIMASIVSIYGLVIAVIISNALVEKLALFTAFVQLGAGISVGVSGLATGYVGYAQSGGSMQGYRKADHGAGSQLGLWVMRVLEGVHSNLGSSLR
jgi:hypothetical protein